MIFGALTIGNESDTFLSAFLAGYKSMRVSNNIHLIGYIFTLAREMTSLVTWETSNGLIGIKYSERSVLYSYSGSTC